MSHVTQTDLVLASVYFPLLVKIAKSKELISYSKLVEHAKSIHSDNGTVQNAIPVSTGRRLDVVRMFTNQSNCPDLSSLVVNEGTGECGAGFLRSFNPEVVRKEVFDFDWTQVKTDFEGFITTIEKKIKPRKRIKEPKARQLMADYYVAHKNSLPAAIRNQRDYLIESIMDGVAVEDAFQDCITRI